MPDQPFLIEDELDALRGVVRSGGIVNPDVNDFDRWIQEIADLREQLRGKPKEVTITIAIEIAALVHAAEAVKQGLWQATSPNIGGMSVRECGRCIDVLRDALDGVSALLSDDVSEAFNTVKALMEWSEKAVPILKPDAPLRWYKNDKIRDELKKAIAAAKLLLG